MTNGTLLQDKDIKLQESLPKVNIVTPVFAGYGKAKVAPAAEVGKQITPEVLEEEKSLSEEEYEKFEKAYSAFLFSHSFPDSFATNLTLFC